MIEKVGRFLSETGFYIKTLTFQQRSTVLMTGWTNSVMRNTNFSKGRFTDITLCSSLIIAVHRRIESFREVLEKFHIASRQLNSSYHLTKAAMSLRKKTKVIPIILGQNVSPLSPTTSDFLRERESETKQDCSEITVAASTSFAYPLFRAILGHIEEPETGEDISTTFKSWADSILHLVKNINELPGHTGKSISTRLSILAKDLKVCILFLSIRRAGCSNKLLYLVLGITTGHIQWYSRGV